MSLLKQMHDGLRSAMNGVASNLDQADKEREELTAGFTHRFDEAEVGTAKQSEA